jgi:hypothetical protein
MDSTVLTEWESLKTMIAALELDVHKNSNGTAAAGLRVRKGLRSLKKLASGIVKLSLESDKARRASKPKKEKVVKPATTPVEKAKQPKVKK